ncbi:hypothetical protein [Streptomyces sp. NPDC048606]|uniref:hypothetical protein n=1 Tax=Streptomyces sp. NPDC048606 TaxID=3154726 RepID=UPI00341D6D6F
MDIAGRTRTVTVCAVAAALIGATATASLASAAPAVEPEPVVAVLDCVGKPQVKPEEYLLACGDGNNRLVGLDWKSWGRTTATATGTDMVNDCKPYCAAGRFRGYPVEVTLSHPENDPDRTDLRRFTRMRLVFPEAAPAPIPHDVTYKIVW